MGFSFNLVLPSYTSIYNFYLNNCLGKFLKFYGIPSRVWGKDHISGHFTIWIKLGKNEIRLKFERT